MARNPLARDVVMFDVEVAEHEVRVGPSRTVRVPAFSVRLGGVSERMARMSALRQAQTAAGVPPWRPCRREGWRFVKATRHVTELAA